MGLFSNLIMSLIHLLLIATDIIFFFLVTTLLCHKWRTSWLIAFNSIGKPLVDWFTGYIQKTTSHITDKTFSQRALLVVGMLALVFIRFLLVALFSK